MFPWQLMDVSIHAISKDQTWTCCIPSCPLFSFLNENHLHIFPSLWDMLWLMFHQFTWELYMWEQWYESICWDLSCFSQFRNFCGEIIMGIHLKLGILHPRLNILHKLVYSYYQWKDLTCTLWKKVHVVKKDYVTSALKEHPHNSQQNVDAL